MGLVSLGVNRFWHLALEILLYRHFRLVTIHTYIHKHVHTVSLSHESMHTSCKWSAERGTPSSDYYISQCTELRSRNLPPDSLLWSLLVFQNRRCLRVGFLPVTCAYGFFLHARLVVSSPETVSFHIMPPMTVSKPYRQAPPPPSRISYVFIFRQSTNSMLR